MNCQDFESNIDNLARGALMDARARETAIAHESVCARCAARLADERAITSGLRALAAGTKEKEAHARVEAALLAAFRARAASGVAVAETANAHAGARVVAGATRAGDASLADEMVVRPWSWMRTVAVASLASAAALALFMLIPPTVRKTNVSVAENQSNAQRQSGATSGTFETATQKNEQSEQTFANAGASTSPTPPAIVDENLRASVPHRPSVRPIQAMNAGLNRGGARGSQIPRGLAQASGDEEVTTDFIPLMQGERLTQGEGGHLVRIELPRSALERFGLPVNAERAGGRVKADVLLGEDGVARAIRFVR